MVLVGSHTISPFPGPVVGPPVNANIVRGNDNITQAAFNAHDLDATVHVQSSDLASRPAAGVAGRTWVTNDSGTYEHWYDDGTNWQRVYGVDYEEGTWTPTYFAATTDFTSVTYGLGTGGSYVKINDTVWIEALVRTTGITGGVGRVEIRNLPFAIAVKNNFYIGGAANFNVNNPSESYALPGAGLRLTYRTTSNGAGVLMDVVDMDTGAPNKNFLRISGYYKTS